MASILSLIHTDVCMHIRIYIFEDDLRRTLKLSIPEVGNPGPGVPGLFLVFVPSELDYTV